jgi:hypothetical protein
MVPSAPILLSPLGLRKTEDQSFWGITFLLPALNRVVRITYMVFPPSKWEKLTTIPGIHNTFLLLKPPGSGQGVGLGVWGVAHTYNLSYWGGRDQKAGSEPAWANSSQEPILKITHYKKGLVEWLNV